jgi:hypothetical protein
MTRLGFALTAFLGLASVVAQAPVAAQSEASGVTGAVEGIFPNGTTFNGVSLTGLTVGQGIFIAPDGSASGQFQAVLLGTSLLGTSQSVILEGEVGNGSFGGDGSAIFSGTATVTMGDGTLPLIGVPFTVKASTQGLGMTLDGQALPTAAVAAGNITIE